MDLLIIIDMLNGFCRKGYPLSLQSPTHSIEKYISNLILDFQKENNSYLFLCDNHTKNAPELKQYPPHCMKGTHEAEIIDSLIKFSNQDNIVFKNTLSIFYKTDLEKHLNRLKPQNIHLTGVLTDICILFAAYEFRNMGFNTYVHKQGIQAFNNEKQKYFVEYIRDFLGAEIIG